MGIDQASAEVLLAARQQGVSFRQTLTLGRQLLYLTPSKLRALARKYGVQLPPGLGADQFAERFFTLGLGADRVEAIDAASFEGAAIIHDMNLPLPTHLAGSYDAVIDGGSLEHIFNLPVALSNCLRAVRVGGRFFSFTVANNFFGHGFYQFSPELFFRVLAPERGFELEQVLLIEYNSTNIELATSYRWYRVCDPDAIRSRVTMINSRPAIIAVQARKIAELDLLAAGFPQQSDYVHAWGRGAAGNSATRRLLLRLADLPLLGPLALGLYSAYKRRTAYSLKNRRSFTELRHGPAYRTRRG